MTLHMKMIIHDPSDIFRRGFPSAVRDQILAEARKHMAALAPQLAAMAFSQIPPELRTFQNKQSMSEAAQATVELKTFPLDALAGTIQILRAWIARLELDDGPTFGTTKIMITYKEPPGR